MGVARRDRRRAQVREEILETARRVMLDRGVAGLSLSAVARELDLTKAALYHYFSSKQVLVFELLYGALAAHCDHVSAVVEPATSGADALEALIRSSSQWYIAHLDEFRLGFLAPQVGSRGGIEWSPEEFAKIRPFNDRMYGTVGAKIRADQDAGRVEPSLDGRRVAFVAHTSVMGLVTIEGMIEAARDAPLIHAHEAMVDELVAAFRARLHPPP